MSDTQDLPRRFGFKRALNAIGMPTIVGANTVSAEVRQTVDQILQISVEIDELQAAACRVIARATGAEAGCVTSSCSAGLTVAAAAAMTGVDLAKIARLPNTRGLSNEIVLPLAHDINFGAPISQMIRLSGARVVRIGTVGHCGAFHLEGAIGERTAAVFYVDSGDVNPAGSFLSLDRSIEAAHAKAVPVVVDCAAAGDVRPFLEAGADLVLTSAHKQMGAPTCGMICGRLDLVRACYLQNYGIGRAMKVGKEGVAGCMAAVEPGTRAIVRRSSPPGAISPPSSPRGCPFERAPATGSSSAPYLRRRSPHEPWRTICAKLTRPCGSAPPMTRRASCISTCA